MSKRSDRVVAGFMNLSREERDEVIKLLNKFINGNEKKKRDLKEEFNKLAAVDTGPTGGGTCPCCGK